MSGVRRCLLGPDTWHSCLLHSVPALGFLPLLMSGWLGLGALLQRELMSQSVFAGIVWDPVT